MKTLSSPLVAACCYNICLLVARTAIRLHKGVLRATTLYPRYSVAARVRQRRPLQLLCIRPSARGALSHVKIYLLPSPPPPAPPLSSSRCALLFFADDRGVCQPPLSPFHTVITHLYIRRELSRKKSGERVSRAASPLLCVAVTDLPPAPIHRARVPSSVQFARAREEGTRGKLVASIALIAREREI